MSNGGKNSEKRWRGGEELESKKRWKGAWKMKWEKAPREESQLCVRDFCLSKFRAVRIDCVRGSGFMGKYFVLKPTLASSGGWREILQYNTHSIDV